MGRKRTRKPGPLAEFGGRVQAAREALKMTQADLAEAIGIGTNARISKVENGHTGLQTMDMVKLLRFFENRGIDVGKFILAGATDDPWRPKEPDTTLERRLEAIEKKIAGR